MGLLTDVNVSIATVSKSYDYFLHSSISHDNMPKDKNRVGKWFKPPGLNRLKLHKSTPLSGINSILPGLNRFKPPAGINQFKPLAGTNQI